MRFKASPYRHPMTGQLRPGKTHGLRDKTTSVCGLTLARVPGRLQRTRQVRLIAWCACGRRNAGLSGGPDNLLLRESQQKRLATSAY